MPFEYELVAYAGCWAIASRNVQLDSCEYSEFVMTGGSIANNTGSAVYLSGKAKLTGKGKIATRLDNLEKSLNNFALSSKLNSFLSEDFICLTFQFLLRRFYDFTAIPGYISAPIII